jgi:transposase
MAKREDFMNLTQAERKRRTFSEGFKKMKIREIEAGQTKIREICRQYNVSPTAVYQWIHKYGTNKGNKERLIIETMSDTLALKQLKERLAELERLLGQKQIEIEYYKKMIELAEEHYGVEIKKNSSTQPSDGSGSREKGGDFQ